MPKYIVEINLPPNPTFENFTPEEVAVDVCQSLEQNLESHYPPSHHLLPNRDRYQVVCSHVSDPLFIGGEKETKT